MFKLWEYVSAGICGYLQVPASICYLRVDLYAAGTWPVEAGHPWEYIRTNPGPDFQT
jgi:hypothetical protein